MPEDVLDILLRLSNLQSFVAGSKEASASIRQIGAAAREGSAEASSATTKLSGVAGLASKALKGTAVAAAAFGYESVKMAINFDKQMELIHTQAGAGQKEVTAMSKAILDMSATGQYAQGPTILAQGLYHLESIGLRGAKALNALKIASQGAAVGNADLEETTTALGSAWLVGIKGAGDLHHTMAVLNATVGAGNMRMNDLVQSLGTGVLPAAKLAGLGLTDTMGALATLTDEGWQGSSAMAQFATSLHFLTDPTTKAKKALAQLHLGVTTLANTLRTQGLPAALQMLREHLNAVGDPNRANQILGNILPAGRGRVLEVLMNQANRVQMKVNQIDRTSRNFADDVAKTHATAAFKIHAAWGQIQGDMIHVGHLLEPIAVAAAVGFSHLLTWIIKIAPGLAHIIPYLAPLAAGFLAYRAALLAAAAAQVLMSAGGFIAAIVTLIPEVSSLKDAWVLLDLAMDANPIFIVIAALVAIGTAVVMAYMHFKGFRDAVHAVFSWLSGAAKATVGAVVAAWNWLKQAAANTVAFIKQHWRLLILVFGGLGLAIDFVTKHWNWFAAAGKFAWSIISGAARWAWNSVIHPVFNAMVSAVSWVVNFYIRFYSALFKILSAPFKWAWEHVIKPVANWIVGAFRWVANEVAKAFNKIAGPIKAVGHWLGGAAGTVGGIGRSVGNFLGLQGGGTVTSAGPVWVGEHGPELLNLPAGAQVRPLSGPEGRSTGALNANFQFVIPVQINGREVARATGKYVDDRLARQ